MFGPEESQEQTKPEQQPEKKAEGKIALVNLRSSGVYFKKGEVVPADHADFENLLKKGLIE